MPTRRSSLPSMLVPCLFGFCVSARTVPAQAPADLTKLDLVTLQQRASAGDAVAQFNVGWRYSLGRGVIADTVLGVAWYRKSAEQGYALAEYRLADCLEEGRGVTQDYAQAIAWYRKAADQGLSAAQYRLALMYEQGLGTSRNIDEARVWLQKASDQGDKQSKEELTRLESARPSLPNPASASFDADQNISGVWTGRLGLGTETDMFNMTLNLNQTGKDVSGTARIVHKVAKDAYASFHVSGTMDAASGQLSLIDDSIIEDGPTTHGATGQWCRKIYQGHLSVQGSTLVLDGNWSNDGRNMFVRGQLAVAQANCTASSFSVSRDVPVDIPQSRIAVAPVPSPPDRGIGARSADTTQTPVHIPHNYALIFATDDYAHWPHLTNPIPDADAVNQTLTSLYGFQVEEVRNPTDEQILQKLTEYLHRKFEPQDQLMIFFSGHGYFDAELGKGFLVPANAQLVDNDIGHRTLIAHETFMGYVNRIPAKHVVLVLDACFAGTLDRRTADGGMRGDDSGDFYGRASLPELLARKQDKRTRRYFTSGGKEFVPDGKPGHHSPFISAFLITLNNAADRKGYVTLNDIQQGFDTVKPEPRWGDIQDENDPGADFLLLTPAAIRQLNAPQ